MDLCICPSMSIFVFCLYVWVSLYLCVDEILWIYVFTIICPVVFISVYVTVYIFRNQNICIIYSYLIGLWKSMTEFWMIVWKNNRVKKKHYESAMYGGNIKDGLIDRGGIELEGENEGNLRKCWRRMMWI